MCDMAHVSGLVAAGVIPSPFDLCDIVTTTTHKSLRGPRGAMIFYRRGERRAATPKAPAVAWDLEARINGAVFPGLQVRYGAPRCSSSQAALCTASSVSCAGRAAQPHHRGASDCPEAGAWGQTCILTTLSKRSSLCCLRISSSSCFSFFIIVQAASPEFKGYAAQVLANCARFAKGLQVRPFDDGEGYLTIPVQGVPPNHARPYTPPALSPAASRWCLAAPTTTCCSWTCVPRASTGLAWRGSARLRGSRWVLSPVPPHSTPLRRRLVATLP